MKKLKERWGINSDFQIVLIITVFALTGSTSVWVAKPILEFFSITKDNLSAWIYWPIRILIIFPIYQVLLVCMGTIFGQFRFFWNFEKKMLRRFGLKLD